MQPLRRFIRDHRWLAIWLVTLALCMKVVMPSGFMLGAAGKSLSITICDGRGLEQARQISLPEPGAHHQPAEQRGAPDACPYAGLGMAALSGAPALLLGGALAFILIQGVRPSALRQFAPRRFLRPPLRAPPRG